MAIFLQKDIHQLLLNKFVVIIGCSVQRTVYKDLVMLLQGDKYMTDSQVRAKGEMSFAGDELIEGGKKGIMHNGINYKEVRQYNNDYHLVRFYFITRCYNSYVESILADLSQEPKPDVVIFNSCLWDINRYGNCAVKSYKEKLDKLFTQLKEALPEQCLLIWNTTLPVSKNAKGGVLIPEMEYMNSTLRLEILEGNFFARQLAVKHGIDVIDLHFFLRHHLHRRAGDGIHWDMTAHRRITNLFLTHIAEAWGLELPKHRKHALLTKSTNLCAEKNDIDACQKKPSVGTLCKKNKQVVHKPLVKMNRCSGDGFIRGSSTSGHHGRQRRRRPATHDGHRSPCHSYNKASVDNNGNLNQHCQQLATFDNLNSSDNDRRYVAHVRKRSFPPYTSGHYADLGYGSHYADLGYGSHYADQGYGDHYADRVYGDHYADRGYGDHYADRSYGDHYADQSYGDHYADQGYGGYYASRIPTNRPAASWEQQERYDAPVRSSCGRRPATFDKENYPHKQYKRGTDDHVFKVRPERRHRFTPY